MDRIIFEINQRVFPSFQKQHDLCRADKSGANQTQHDILVFLSSCRSVYQSVEKILALQAVQKFQVSVRHSLELPVALKDCRARPG